jgi:hypothetical protein
LRRQAGLGPDPRKSGTGQPASYLPISSPGICNATKTPPIEGSGIGARGEVRNLTKDSSWGPGLAGGVGSMLVEAFHSLELLLVPSPKIYNQHQNNMRKLLVSSEFEVLEVSEGERIPSSPS